MFLDVISYGYLLLIINNLRNPALNHNPQVPRSNRGFATKDIKGLAQASPFRIFRLWRICATTDNHIDCLCMVSQVCGTEMRVPLHHLHRLPTAHFLHCITRCAVLHQPRRPAMAQIVPAEVFNSRRS